MAGAYQGVTFALKQTIHEKQKNVPRVGTQQQKRSSLSYLGANFLL